MVQTIIWAASKPSSHTHPDASCVSKALHPFSAVAPGSTSPALGSGVSACTRCAVVFRRKDIAHAAQRAQPRACARPGPHPVCRLGRGATGGASIRVGTHVRQDPEHNGHAQLRPSKQHVRRGCMPVRQDYAQDKTCAERGPGGGARGERCQRQSGVSAPRGTSEPALPPCPSLFLRCLHAHRLHDNAACSGP